MIDRFDQLDSIEISLRELADAERADLFRKTQVDARSLLRATHADNLTSRALRRLRWVPIAAVLGMAATIGGWLFTTGTGGNRTASATRGCGDTFYRCMTGPNGMIMSGCDTCDYNADGHIDMLDASTHQLSGSGITR